MPIWTEADAARFREDADRFYDSGYVPNTDAERALLRGRDSHPVYGDTTRAPGPRTEIGRVGTKSATRIRYTLEKAYADLGAELGKYVVGSDAWIHAAHARAEILTARAHLLGVEHELREKA